MKTSTGTEFGVHELFWCKIKTSDSSLLTGISNRIGSYLLILLCFACIYILFITKVSAGYMLLKFVIIVYVVYLCYLVVRVGKYLYLRLSDYCAPLIKVCMLMVPFSKIFPTRSLIIIQIYVGGFVLHVYRYILFIVMFHKVYICI